MKRHIIQIALQPEVRLDQGSWEPAVLYAVASDGTLWRTQAKWGAMDPWQQLLSLPDSKEVPS